MHSRLVAGVRCDEVLAELSDFLDGSLAPEREQQLRAHVAECNACECFGADVQTALQALRTTREAASLSDDLSERLAQRIKDL